ncbi:serine/threonine-protein kinase [Nostoc sp. 2RC]|uniref:serine/threonine-protein kinase n=1 Tax=Nostoc sp. 2RC TaxID=2485484 RepID=UPI001626522D|nr:serine/threonine-protein kinase [Nostoc sp. 2RC]MBC1237915.1 serine/threonine protein kinase [Nostoc sp. 2RC]
MTRTKLIIGGHYEILRSLGQGNFGQTYLAEDLHARKRKVVVKQFCFVGHSQTTLNKAKELFEREAEVLYDLSNEMQNHQIPRFIAFFEEKQEFYLVEEYIAGQTLREELAQKNRLPEYEVIDLLKDVLSILKVINEKRIIHRDIKPDNIIIRANDGKRTVIDFGAVKEISRVVNTQFQTKQTIIYTPGYSPLEQLKGSAKFNSDIYALGMTALEALTGLEPEKLRDEAGKIIWPDDIQASDGLVEILEKMVNEDYCSRYQSAADVLIDLVELEKPKNTLMLAPKNYLPVQTIHKTLLQQRSIIPQWFRFPVLPLIVIAVFGSTSFFSVKRLLMPLENNSSVSQPKPQKIISKEASEKSSNLPNKNNNNQKNINPCPPILAPGKTCQK